MSNVTSEVAYIISQARKYKSKDRIEIALLILEGGIIRLPNQIDLLEEYTSLAICLAERLSFTERLQYLEQIGVFAQSRIQFANAEHIDRIVEISEEVFLKKEILDKNNIDLPCELSNNQILILDSAKNNNLDYHNILPENINLMLEAEKSIEGVLEWISKDASNGYLAEKLQDELEKIHGAKLFDAGIAEVSRLLDSTASGEDCINGYLFQQADQILRNLVIEPIEISNFRRQQLVSMIQRLSSESEAASIKSRNKDASLRFNATRLAIENEIAELDKVKISELNIADGAIQKKLLALQKSIQRLLELAPAVSGTDYAKRVSEELHQLQTKAVDWSNKQQQRYDKWAIHWIRNGYDKASRHISSIMPDNEQKISLEIVINFGHIDIRLLSPEVQRTYSEIFEILFGRLNSPKKDEKKDYEDKGGKLYTLKKLMDTKKKTLSDF